MMKIITTSWDDGLKESIEIGSMLENYGLSGTFYVPVNAFTGGRVENIEGDKFMNKSELKRLSENFEIGSHGLSHRYLPTLSAEEVDDEFIKSKNLLEELIDEGVKGFAYPAGRFGVREVKKIKKSGYLYTRTVKDGILKPQKRFKLPVSVFCSNSFISRSKFTFLSPFSKVYAFGGDWEACVLKAYKNLKREGGVLHLAGHPQDISRNGYKQKLKSVLSKISRDSEIEYLTNYQAVRRLKNEGYLD